MVKIPIQKVPSGVSNTPTEPNSAATISSSNKSNPTDSFAKTPGNLFSKSSPMMSGAMGVWGKDGVMLPTGLTNPADPKNDAKYLRLFSAILGMDELERYFVTREEAEQQAYIAHKQKLREERLAKLEGEKEEKRKQQEQEADEENDNEA